MESIINLNEQIFISYQNSYPNLKAFSYDSNDNALYYERYKIKFNIEILGHIDPVFFQILPQDIFLYFKNEFYQSTNELAQISLLLNQLTINESEEKILINFVRRFKEKCQIYFHNKKLLDSLCTSNENVKAFTKTLLESKDLINKAKILCNKPGFNASAARIICKTYENDIQDLNSFNQGNENTVEKGVSLTRSKPGFGKFDEEEYVNEKNQIGIAGFSSIILLITFIIIAGIYLAITIIK